MEDFSICAIINEEGFMNFTRKWTIRDINDYYKFLKENSKGAEKAEWEKRIANTSMPCLAVPSTVVDIVARDISKSDYISFLNIWPWEYLVDTQVIAKVLNRIQKDDRYWDYLDRYVNLCDNWASTDCLRFKLTRSNKEKLWEKAIEYINNDRPFVKRVGMIILMKAFVCDEYIDKIFEILNSLKGNDHYYVMMMEAWLLCECVIKVRSKSIQYLQEANLDKFVINKAISKCRDSYRLSSAEKEYLKSLKRV